METGTCPCPVSQWAEICWHFSTQPPEVSTRGAFSRLAGVPSRLRNLSSCKPWSKESYLQGRLRELFLTTMVWPHNASKVCQFSGKWQEPAHSLHENHNHKMSVGLQLGQGKLGSWYDWTGGTRGSYLARGQEHSESLGREPASASTLESSLHETGRHEHHFLNPLFLIVDKPHEVRPP